MSKHGPIFSLFDFLQQVQGNPGVLQNRPLSEFGEQDAEPNLTIVQQAAPPSLFLQQGQADPRATQGLGGFGGISGQSASPFSNQAGSNAFSNFTTTQDDPFQEFLDSLIIEDDGGGVGPGATETDTVGPDSRSPGGLGIDTMNIDEFSFADPGVNNNATWEDIRSYLGIGATIAFPGWATVAMLANILGIPSPREIANEVLGISPEISTGVSPGITSDPTDIPDFIDDFVFDVFDPEDIGFDFGIGFTDAELDALEAEDTELGDVASESLGLGFDDFGDTEDFGFDDFGFDDFGDDEDDDDDGGGSGGGDDSDTGDGEGGADSDDDAF